MRPTDIANIKALIELLKAEGVRSFKKGQLTIEFFAPEGPAAAQNEPVRDFSSKDPEIPGKLGRMDSNYFHPGLGKIEFR